MASIASTDGPVVMNVNGSPVDPLIPIAPGAYVHAGAADVGVLVEGDRVLTFDYGDGAVADALHELGIRKIESVFVTHHHRDQVCGLLGRRDPLLADARIAVPAAERAWFEEVDRLWADPVRRWHVYDLRPDRGILAEPLAVDLAVATGDSFTFGPWRIDVLSTPGHTDGSVSYLASRAGHRLLFCGDLIAGPGQVWDLYSLQHGGRFGELVLRDYHGFLGARNALLDSLARADALSPKLLVPSHGVVMDRPSDAIAALRANLTAAYEQYAAISALRYYFPEVFAKLGDRPDVPPAAPTAPIPAFVRHVETTWIVISQSGAALVMDCGTPRVIDTIQAMKQSGDIREVEALWISHYHDDHVDAVPEFQRRFPCPTYADATVAEVVTRPADFFLPCLSPSVVRVDRATNSGESWDWREFRLTAYHFPGQTFYHGALLVEGRGLRLFFIGDSFTPSGIDDYCAANRNLLGPGRGFDACLSLVEQLRPDYLFNCHVDAAFAFSPDSLSSMRSNLASRVETFGRLVPWDDPNYALDEHWVRCRPYEQVVAPGQTARLDVAVTNHSPVERTVAASPDLPSAWGKVPPATACIAPRSDGVARLAIPIPVEVPPGRYVVPVTIEFAGRRLVQFREAVIIVKNVSSSRPEVAQGDGQER